MKKLFLLFATLFVAALSGCASIRNYDYDTQNRQHFIHNTGWDAIKDPAEGVLKLSTTRDWYKGGGGVIDILHGVSYGPPQLAAGYSMRTCIYSPASTYNTTTGTLNIAGSNTNERQSGIDVNAVENRMGPCMYLQAYYNELASGVGGYCTANGAPTPKFIQKATEFAQDQYMRALSALVPVYPNKYDWRWSDQTPDDFARSACHDAAISAKVGGFWNVGCPSYRGGVSSHGLVPLVKTPEGFVAANPSNEQQENGGANNWGCQYSKYAIFAYSTANGSSDKKIATQLDFLSLNPFYKSLLSQPNPPINIPEGSQMSAARQYLTALWAKLSAEHPYTGAR